MLLYNNTRSIPEEDLKLVNMYKLNNGAHKYIKKLLTDFKSEIYSNVIVVGNINIPLPTMNRSSVRKS